MSSPSSSSFKALAGLTPGQLVNSTKHKFAKVISIDEKTTVEEALALLKKHKILSLPVWDSEAKTYVGVLNLFDIVCAIAFQPLFDSFKDNPNQLDGLKEEAFQNAHNLKVFDAPAVQLLGISAESKSLWVADAKDDVRDLIDVFCKGVHRALVKFRNKPEASESKNADADDEGFEGYTVRILSQSDIVRYLNAHSKDDGIREVMDRTLVDLKLVPASEEQQKKFEVTQLSSKSRALLGFQKMIRHDVTAVPVVDENGRLVATLSASDMRGITRDTLKETLLPVLDFIQLRRGDALAMHEKVPFAKTESPHGGWKGDEGVYQPPVAFSPTTTLRRAVETMVRRKVHRGWVLDDETSKVISVVTLSDVIGVFSPYAVSKAD